jgi:hypothetical protein
LPALTASAPKPVAKTTSYARSFLACSIPRGDAIRQVHQKRRLGTHQILKKTAYDLPRGVVLLREDHHLNLAMRYRADLTVERPFETSRTSMLPSPNPNSSRSKISLI